MNFNWLSPLLILCVLSICHEEFVFEYYIPHDFFIYIGHVNLTTPPSYVAAVVAQLTNFLFSAKFLNPDQRK